MGEIAAFGIRQTGQLEISNADKGSAARILATCDDAWTAALKSARPKRFLGLM